MKFGKWFIAGLAVLALVLAGCAVGGEPERTGSIDLRIGNVAAKSFLPPYNLEINNYTLTVTPPEGAVYTGPTTIDSNGHVLLPGLAAGLWSFHVVCNAYKAGGFIGPAGEGDGSATVELGGLTPLHIDVIEYSGPGSYLLNITSWPATPVIASPALRGTLKDFSGAIIEQGAFSVNTGERTATSTTTGIPAGWHTNVVRIYSAPGGFDGSEVWFGGLAVAVRIAQGQTTTGATSMSTIVGGGLDLFLDPDFHDELILTGSPAFGAVSVGATETVDFSASSTETTTSAIYLFGDARAVDLYSMSGASLAVGIVYRVDIISFSTDGRRAGCGTWTVTRTP